ncbi:toll/interleukin-1 receptor domain-containing protein [Massilia sp. SYSU DXS3249]
MIQNPTGFLSYARDDDEHEGGRLTDLRRRLNGELVIQTGERIEIFQDTKDIGYGQDWKKRIDDCIDRAAFFICVVTPSFLKSEACRHEFERFARRERKLGRTDLILPVYHIHSLLLENEYLRAADPIAQLISERNYVDWRSLRFRPLGSPRARKMIADLARDIRRTLDAPAPAGGMDAQLARRPARLTQR